MDETKLALQQALELAAAQLQQALQQEQDTKALKELTGVLKELTELSAKLYGTAADREDGALEVIFAAGPDAWDC